MSPPVEASVLPLSCSTSRAGESASNAFWWQWPCSNARFSGNAVRGSRSLPARAALLSVTEDEDLLSPFLRAIVGALRARPDALAESLLVDLDDSARSVLTALLLEEDRRFPEDPAASIAGFRRHLEREHRLRRQRRIAQSIGAAQRETGVNETPFQDFQALHRESKVVYEMLGNVAQSLEPSEKNDPRRSSDE